MGDGELAEALPLQSQSGGRKVDDAGIIFNATKFELICHRGDAEVAMISGKVRDDSCLGE